MWYTGFRMGRRQGYGRGRRNGMVIYGQGFCLGGGFAGSYYIITNGNYKYKSCMMSVLGNQCYVEESNEIKVPLVIMTLLSCKYIEPPPSSHH